MLEEITTAFDQSSGWKLNGEGTYNYARIQVEGAIGLVVRKDRT